MCNPELYWEISQWKSRWERAMPLNPALRKQCYKFLNHVISPLFKIQLRSMAHFEDESSREGLLAKVSIKYLDFWLSLTNIANFNILSQRIWKRYQQFKKQTITDISFSSLQNLFQESTTVADKTIWHKSEGMFCNHFYHWSLWRV